jgi:hypothetical protein
MNQQENVFEFGEFAENFYVIISGVVSVQIRNPKIKNWAEQRNSFKMLLEWKEKVFDPRVK